MEQFMNADNQQERLCELSWLGGIIDGEGCISFKRNTGKCWKKKERPSYPMISVANTDLIMIEKIIQILEKHEIAYYREDRKGKAKNNDSVAICIKGLKRTKRFLDLIIPFLVSKRKRAELLLEFCQLRQHNHKAYTPYEKQLCQSIYDIGRGTIAFANYPQRLNA
jgi:hypothetical protein